MKTPLQELHHWVSTELKLDGYEHRVILDKIESLLEYEEKIIKQSYYDGIVCSISDQDTDMLTLAENYYNETFNPKKEQLGLDDVDL
jgi:5'-3' exonuclease